MAASDRSKWNEKYLQGSHTSADASLLITELDSILPIRGRAIDVAGGAGRHALWMARRGLDVTLADISAVAIEMARQRATADRLNLQTLTLDLEDETFPPGPWDLILDFHFLSRGMLPKMTVALAVGGLLIVVQPTHKNLERHPKPSAEYLLDEGELPTLVPGLEIVRFDEGWLAEGRHEARLVARRINLECGDLSPLSPVA